MSLSSVCDFRFNYAGCSNASDLALVDLVWIGLSSTTLLLYTGYLAARVYANRRVSLKQWFHPKDTICVLAFFCSFFRIVYYTNVRSILFASPEQRTSPAYMSFYVGTNVLLDFVVNVTGAMCFSTCSLLLVQIASGLHLYRPFRKGSRTIDPSSTLKLIRLVILLSYLVCCILLVVYGGTGAEAFVYWRRPPFLILSGSSLFLSAPMTLFFGMQIIRDVQTVATQIQQLHADPKKPADSKKSSLLLKSTMPPSGSYSIAEHSQNGIQSVVVLDNQSTINRNNSRLDYVQACVVYIVGLYVVSAVFISSFVWGNEAFQTRPTSMFLVKFFGDFYWFVSPISFFIYLLFCK
ncbi:hypothetical protein HDV03_005265 [Kappamyces sp. JEL0829]|nr:hypothetical protein HDV03_005265 [Kappamyces sp. JEL0829]